MSAIVAKVGGIHKLSSLTGFGMVAVARDSLVEEPKGESSSKSGASFEASGGHIVCTLPSRVLIATRIGAFVSECLDACK